MVRPPSVTIGPIWLKPSRLAAAPAPDAAPQLYITQVEPRASTPAVTGKAFLPQPASARSGAAWPSAHQIMCMISWAGKTVHMVKGAGGFAFTTVPLGALIVRHLKVPSLRGM